MACKFIVQSGARRIECSNKELDNEYCLFQYWCTAEDVYKCTGTANKCKYYEESSNDSKQLNK